MSLDKSIKSGKEWHKPRDHLHGCRKVTHASKMCGVCESNRTIRTQKEKMRIEESEREAEDSYNKNHIGSDFNEWFDNDMKEGNIS